MAKVKYLLIITLIVNFYDYCATSGLPCSLQHTMRPVRGRAQEIGEHPPPYNLFILNSEGDQIKYYKNEVYTVVLNSTSTYFRGFLIQARLSTRQGFVIGHLRAGGFIQDDNWEDQGIKFQKCPSFFNDSITNSDGKEKRQISFKWTPRKNDGAVQFVLTIIKESDTFWVQWSPEVGLIFADTEAKFTEEISIPLKGDSNQNLKPSESKVIVSSSFSHVNRSKSLHNILDKNQKSSNVEETDKFESHTALETTEPFPTLAHENQKKLSGSEEGSVEVSPPKVESGETIEDTAISATIANELTTSEKSFSIRILTLPPDDDNFSEIERFRIFSTDEKLEKPGLKNKANKNLGEIDYCFDFPCFNNGTCNSLKEEKRYQCVCPEEWLGDQCLERNYCLENPCKNHATCVNTEDGPACKCGLEWAGELCEDSCPSYICENGGTCMINKKSGEYLCDCKPGWTGFKCEKNINECDSDPCFNNGTCIDKIASFECQCPEGYMGQRCHRPCQDIYHSCDSWRDEDKCDIMRATTKFFDINCAKSCDQCIYDNETVRTSTPLPPVLEPFEFLLGSWNINFTGRERFPLDFNDAHFGYYEELNFFVSNVTMFGTPFINYSSIAINVADKSDVLLNVGFMTLKPSANELSKASIMSTGNDGVTVIEEGLLKGHELNLTTEYFAVFPSVKSPKKVIMFEFMNFSQKTLRRYATNGKYLEENVIRIDGDGTRKSFTKYYYRLAQSNSF